MALTPLMQQYQDAKSQHPDKLLLFRMGDFYELFGDDAVVASQVLSITLTQRNRKAGDDTPMCGFPHFALGSHINKLLTAGHSVAICEQVEDPKLAQGLVKRAVVECLSPGMVYDIEAVDPKASVYIAALSETNVAFYETSTHEAFYIAGSELELIEHILAMDPKELIVRDGFELQKLDSREPGGYCQTLESRIKKFRADATNLSAVDLLKAFLTHMHYAIPSWVDFHERRMNQQFRTNTETLAGLEILRPHGGKDGELGSLIKEVDLTVTPGGARRLRDWLTNPLICKTTIMNRQAQGMQWQSRTSAIIAVRSALKQVGDIERRLARVNKPTKLQWNLVQLMESLDSARHLESYLLMKPDSLAARDQLLAQLKFYLATSDDQAAANESYAHKDATVVIAYGADCELDKWRELAANGQRHLMDLESRLKLDTQIPSLKIKYNSVFGYFIEVTKVHAAKVPASFIRKQTLTSSERYTFGELEALAGDLLKAHDELNRRELQILEDLRSQVLNHAALILELAHALSELDLALASSLLVLERQYCWPQFTDCQYDVRASRHPVVSARLKHKYVSNDMRLMLGDFWLITGPNMGGKSTLMRQLALTSWLAQCGLPVPARSAELPLVDGIFTRIGANDRLADGQSTFMVEMSQTAAIIERASHRSLIIFDELGRGTGTYDGMSLAEAIIRFVIEQIGATTLFATHYQELAHLDQVYERFCNYHLAITEIENSQAQSALPDLKFLYTLKSGVQEESFGVHVARLAGLPLAITDCARRLLESRRVSQACASSPIEQAASPVVGRDEAVPLN